LNTAEIMFSSVAECAGEVIFILYMNSERVAIVHKYEGWQKKFLNRICLREIDDNMFLLILL